MGKLWLSKVRWSWGVRDNLFILDREFLVLRKSEREMSSLLFLVVFILSTTRYAISCV